MCEAIDIKNYYNFSNVINIKNYMIIITVDVWDFSQIWKLFEPAAPSIRKFVERLLPLSEKELLNGKGVL